MTTTHRWVAGVVATALLLVLGSWFLLISPQRSQVAELRDQATTQQATNDAIRLRTQQLKAQFASLPQRRAQLVEIQQQMPATPDLSALVRQLSTVAADAGVSVDSVAPGQPQPLAGAAAGAGTGTSSTGTGSGTAGLQAIALTTVVKGGYPDLTLFLQKLQGSMPRAYLVENLSLKPGEAANDATTSGTSLTMTVTGKVFVLTPATASTGAAQGSTTTATTTPAN